MNLNEISSSLSRMSEKVRETASKSVENVKTENQIRELQAEIDDAFRLMGALLYKHIKEGSDIEPDYNELIKKIDSNNETIISLKQSKAVQKDRFCSSCGKKIDDTAAFCPHCGAKQ